MTDAMGHGFRHPLDVDLADFADDLVDSAQREALEDHLSVCLLCRIKVSRLREALRDQSEVPHSGQSGLEVGTSINAGLSAIAPLEDLTVDQLKAGQLWAAGKEQRLLVLILREQHGRAFVAPVTFDAGAADDETVVVVEASTFPFATSIAVYPMLAAELPKSSLAACFGQLVATGDLDQLVAGRLAGTTRGEPIEGPTDPRLEFRQMLADHLGTLEEIAPDPDTAAYAPAPGPERLASALAAALRLRRGERCRLHRLRSWDDLITASARGWTPLASVDELGAIFVVFDTPSGLANSDDFNAAIGVLTRYSASAVVVLATSLSPHAEIFDAASLKYGIGVPSGEERPPAPILSGLAPVDAIAKFLDEYSSRSETMWSTRASTSPSDVVATLSRSAASAVAEVANQGRNYRIIPKKAGYTSVEHFVQNLDEVLRDALDGGEVAERISDLANRSEW